MQYANEIKNCQQTEQFVCSNNCCDEQCVNKKISILIV